MCGIVTNIRRIQRIQKTTHSPKIALAQSRKMGINKQKKILMELISSLVMRYVACFPAHWKSRVCYHWSLENLSTSNILFSITPLPGETCSDEFEVKSMLEKSFTVLAFSDDVFQLRDSLQDLLFCVALL